MNDATLINASKDELIQIIQTLEDELDESQTTYSRRGVLKGAGATLGVGVLGVMATKNVSAAPSGTFPAETDDPLKRARVDRVRYITRSGAPTAPSSGRVLSYVDSGDLP